MEIEKHPFYRRMALPNGSQASFAGLSRGTMIGTTTIKGAGTRVAKLMIYEAIALNLCTFCREKLLTYTHLWTNTQYQSVSAIGRPDVHCDEVSSVGPGAL